MRGVARKLKGFVKAHPAVVTLVMSGAVTGILALAKGRGRR